MISLDRASYQVQPRYAEYAGLSTDVKPVESIDNGDEFQEIDTGYIYKFDVETSQWIQQPTGGGGGGTSNYNDLTNKPQINGITLTGNKTTEQLGINIPAELPNPFALTFTGAVTAEYDGSGAVSVEIPEPSGGTTDYNELSNKPSINGVVLEGNKTTEQININIPTSLPNPNKLIFTGASTQEYDGSSEITVNIPNSEVTTSYNDLTNKPQINGIELIENKTSADLGIDGIEFTLVARAESDGEATMFKQTFDPVEPGIYVVMGFFGKDTEENKGQSLFCGVGEEVSIFSFSMMRFVGAVSRIDGSPQWGNIIFVYDGATIRPISGIYAQNTGTLEIPNGQYRSTPVASIKELAVYSQIGKNVPVGSFCELYRIGGIQV